MDSNNIHPDKPDHGSAARRGFLQRLGLLGAVGVAASMRLIELNAADADLPGTSAASSTQRWGLLIESSKCASDCDACVRGCNEEHGIADTGNPAIDAQWIRKIALKDNLSERESSLPMMCQHCESAPCVDVCPTGASFKRADGVVLVNKHTCIGCRYCVMACPYKARSFIHEVITDQKPAAPRGKGTVEGCTLCVHRIDSGKNLQTACADACSKAGHDAIVFGDMNDPLSTISQAMRQQSNTQVRADLQLNTGVRYIGL